MADKYGPIFTVKLGLHRALVVSSWEFARECFTVHDKAFSTRPIIAATRLMGYNCAMFGFAPYGPFWREMRRITTTELLSNAQLDKMRHVRASEVENAIKELYEHASERGSSPVDMKRWFGDLNLNFSLRFVGGKHYQDSRKKDPEYCRRLVRDFFNMFGVFVLSDAIPMLGWWDMNGYRKLMKQTAKGMDALVGGWLEEHKRRRLSSKEGKELEDDDEKDFMGVLIDNLDGASISGFDADTIIKATCANLLIAGSDITMVVLTWALSLLLNNGDALRKAQEELDIHVGRDRRVEESDIRNLVYLQAVIKETMRLYPPAPVLGLREAMEDCTFTSSGSSYHVSAGTRLLVNIHKIQRDERVWPEPDKFMPERFLTEAHRDVDVRGQSFELMPFGSGRRACAGIGLGLVQMHLALASLLQGFNVSTVGNTRVDMTESSGLTNFKATPLEVLVTPRLNSELYR
ncbi:hypothetical protein CDL15_Pgr013527 [Punica granatum]|nr:hypothetical protein CDL15_Pgr013527 [Punica granatum]